LSEKHNSFLRLLKKKGFREERMTKFGLYAIGKTTTLESNKSLKTIAQEVLVDSGADVCLFDAEGGAALGIPIERVRIPRQSCHRFQVNPATDSMPKLPPVPHESCH
jgi:hypothetical protein